MKRADRPYFFSKSLIFAFGVSLLLLYGCGSGGSGGGAALPLSEEEELVSQAFAVFQRYYFEPALVREPLETDTLQTYVDSYRSPDDIYTRYVDAPAAAFLKQEHEPGEELLFRRYEPNVLYIAFDEFAPGSARRVIEAVENGIAAGGVDTLILDLRLNLGGRVTEATTMLDYFSAGQPEGTVMTTTQGQHPIANQVYLIGDTRGENGVEDRFDGSNMYVLTSGLTASATEILVAGLLHFNEATQVGSTTFGKNRLLVFNETPRGDGYYLTIARVFHADGIDREGIGLLPEAGESNSPFEDVAGIVGIDAPDPIQADWGLSNQFLAFLYDRDFWRESSLAAGLRPSIGPLFRSWSY